MKKKLLVSFSGGETSAYMAQWFWKHKQSEFDMIFVFANTGQENEETLIFAKKVSEQFGFPLVWIETIVFEGKRKGSEFKVIDFTIANREGVPFEQVIKKYGIPNSSFPHCTRELKTTPIHKYAKSVWNTEDYFTAIGIRIDEIDRIDKNREAKRFIYPLISQDYIPMTKPKINFWWSQQSFRLELKGYQGNCKTCWKKTDSKLFTLAKENERQFNFFSKMEQRYGKYIPDTRMKLMNERGELPVYPITFFRKNRSAIEMINQSKSFDKIIIDDALEIDEQCEVHSECGDNN